MRAFSRILALVLSLCLVARAQSFDVRGSGSHTLVGNDSADTARRLASLDAAVKALESVRTSLAGLASVKALGLTELELTAYLAGIVELPETKNNDDGKVFTSEVSFRLDAADAVRKLEALHHDAEVSLDLIETARRSRALRDKLTGNDRAVVLAKLEAHQSLAQARAAMVREETGPTSAPITSEAGLTRALKLVDRVLTLDPQNADGLRVMGDLLLEDDDPEAAEEAFRAVLKENPNSALDYNKLGNALLSQGMPSEASAEFREAIRLNASDYISHLDLGLALRQQQDPGAIAEFRAAIRINPKYVDGHNNLGIALAGEGKTSEALAEFQEIIRLRPNSALGYFNAATALADLEKDEESTNALRQAVRLNPNHYNAHYNLGEMLRLAGNLEESAKEFREYVNRAPDNPRTERNKERARSFIKAFEEP